jgi:hypothetical protein
MTEELALLRDLHTACLALPPILIPNRLREALIRCNVHYGEDPPHSEDDPTPESLLLQCAEHIDLLLENVGHRDSDGFESPEEWNEADEVAQTIHRAFPPIRPSNRD